MQIFGTKGRIEVQIPFNAPPDKPCRIFVDGGSGLGDSTAREEVFPTTDQYRLQGDEFSRTIRTGGQLEFPLEDAVRNMKVIDAVYRSGESGGWVDIPASA
jgi:predicted dehydrogenase